MGVTTGRVLPCLARTHLQLPPLLAASVAEGRESIAKLDIGIGQSIVDRLPFQHTLHAGYTNGTIGYVPACATYAENGYEVTHACQVAPDAGEQIEEESIRLLRSIHDVL